MEKRKVEESREAKWAFGFFVLCLWLAVSWNVAVCVSWVMGQGVTKEQIAPFRPQAGSPTIGGGVNLWKELGCDTKPENCKDIAGTPLPREGAWPIGAVMYTPPPSRPTVGVEK
jgi:hypothetical protein